MSAMRVGGVSPAVVWAWAAPTRLLLMWVETSDAFPDSASTSRRAPFTWLAPGIDGEQFPQKFDDEIRLSYER